MHPPLLQESGGLSHWMRMVHISLSKGITRLAPGQLQNVEGYKTWKEWHPSVALHGQGLGTATYMVAFWVLGTPGPITVAFNYKRV